MRFYNTAQIQSALLENTYSALAYIYDLLGTYTSYCDNEITTHVSQPQLKSLPTGVANRAQKARLPPTPNIEKMTSYVFCEECLRLVCQTFFAPSAQIYRDSRMFPGIDYCRNI